MVEDILYEEVIKELSERYPEGESRKNLRLDSSLIKEIISIIENRDYDIVPSLNFPTENFSSTSIFQFEEKLMQWIQKEPSVYIPTEQILRDLISIGWTIKPPQGV